MSEPYFVSTHDQRKTKIPYIRLFMRHGFFRELQPKIAYLVYASEFRYGREHRGKCLYTEKNPDIR